MGESGKGGELCPTRNKSGCATGCVENILNIPHNAVHRTDYDWLQFVCFTLTYVMSPAVWQTYLLTYLFTSCNSHYPTRTSVHQRWTVQNSEDEGCFWRASIQSHWSSSMEQSASFHPGLNKHYILLPALKNSFFKSSFYVVNPSQSNVYCSILFCYWTLNV